MKIDDNKKVDILLVALKERYDSLEKIRERVQSIGIWTLGLMLGAAGWLVQDDTILTGAEKVFIILGLFFAFSVLRFSYLANLERGFKGQQRAAVQIEKALGLFTPNLFDSTGEPMYPPNWEKAGTEGGDGKFFGTSYALLYIGIAILVVTILLDGCLF